MMGRKNVSPFYFGYLDFNFRGGMNFTCLEDSGLGGSSMKQCLFQLKEGSFIGFRNLLAETSCI